MNLNRSNIIVLIGWLLFLCSYPECSGQGILRLADYSKKSGIGYGITVDQGYVYMTNNKGVVIADVKDPAELNTVSLIPTGTSFGIAVHSGLAYISGEQGLVIADVRDPEHPEIIGEYPIEGRTQGLLVKDSLVYITGSSGLDILDASDPVRISRISHVDIQGMRALEISQGIIYVAVPGEGVYVVDGTEADLPRKINLLEGTEGAWNVHLYDDYLYVARHGQGISIFNIRNKMDPLLIGTFHDADDGEAQGVWGNGIRLYVADNYGVEVLDVTDPAHPIEVDEYREVSAAHDICSDGTWIYVASGSHGLMLFQVALRLNSGSDAVVDPNCDTMDPLASVVFYAELYDFEGNELSIHHQ